MTPSGWQRGSHRLDGSPGRVEVKRPADAVATFRYTEEIGSDVVLYTGVDMVWKSSDERVVDELTKKFGGAPHKLMG